MLEVAFLINSSDSNFKDMLYNMLLLARAEHT